jgi:cyclopropane-fatty-acyl-phospholipid synthase
MQMKTDHYKMLIQELITPAGSRINGDNPWDIQVNNEQFYPRVIHSGLLGIGEAYMDGWWDCKSLDQLTTRILLAQLNTKVFDHGKTFFSLLLAKLSLIQVLIVNRQNKARAQTIAERHYNLSNELYKAMLDKEMNYTCGYWKNATDLDQAQRSKLQLICDKLSLQPGMTVLDIGCGYGAFAKYAAQNFDVKVVGITISQQQLELGQELCAGLPVELRLQDYRSITGKFDRIVSLGMFEHVGYKNYSLYMKVAHDCLTDDGLFLLHTIGSNISDVKTNTWTNKYIFPNGMLPSIKQIGIACENLFVMEDWHNFGADYDKTLMSWYANFNQHWDELKSQFSERFRRMWNFYLLSSAGSFRARYIQLWQIVLSKYGVLGGYHSVR